jgi:arylsulfatase A-like enzyme
MKRREFLQTLPAMAGLGMAQAQPARRPNILFIMADDLGYGDLGCYGQKQIQTPNIDRLAASGMRFTQAYAGATVCAPSRCALMTGKHSGHGFIRGNANVSLRPQDTTVAEVLKKAGYNTALIGKWGLGEPYSTGTPNRKGFDEWFGYLSQLLAHTYYPTTLWENEKEFMVTGNFSSKRTAYSHDLFTARALSFLERQRAGSPFFLELAYTIPHANNEAGNQTGNGLEVPSDEPYTSRDWPQVEKNFAAMITRMDRDVGRVLDALRARGLDRETLVIFTSDNGPHKEGGGQGMPGQNPEFFHSSGPLRGIKRDLYEGGIRVPAIASWPGVISPGTTSDAKWAFWDFLPTAAELAGAPAPRGIDGMSIVPALQGRPLPNREYFYWEFHEGGFFQGVRMGDWKGVRLKAKAAPIELYDLATDVGEKNNVAAQHPEVVKRIGEIMASARTESAEFPVRN